MRRFLERLWNTSGASLTRAISRRVKRRRSRPAWHAIKSGPAAGAQLFLVNAGEGDWRKMVEGTFDSFLYAALTERLNLKDRICWDIGAHFGYHSLGFAALGARVLAFEPNVENAKLLRMNLERNPALGSRVRHLPEAVADRDGSMSFVQSGDLAGSSSGSYLEAATPPLDRCTQYAGFSNIEVPAVRIDTLIETRHESPPDILKIDVEGAEPLVLRGGSRFFQQHRPVILMEVHHITAMWEVQKLLLQWGYETRILDEEHSTSSRCFILASKD